MGVEALTASRCPATEDKSTMLGPSRHATVTAAVLAFASLLAIITPGGCASPTASPGSRVPDRLSLKLYRGTQDRQFTYFVLSRDSALSFGGGRDAISRSATPVGTLSNEDRQQIWDSITRGQLTTLKNQTFAKSHRVIFEVEIKAGGSRRVFRAIDDNTANLEHLHALLFDMYSDRAYKLPQFRALR